MTAEERGGEVTDTRRFIQFARLRALSQAEADLVRSSERIADEQDSPTHGE